MAPLVGTIGSLQAMEAIKLLSGYGTLPAENRHLRCHDLPVSRNEADASPAVRGMRLALTPHRRREPPVVL
nr:Molybdopterin-synthase adenylyltransferase [Klebsiella pneumoniae]